MRLSTRSRYGTRLMLDMAQHYDQGPIQLGDIARRQEISVKYLEQIIIPLKKANYVKSVRGPKGGHYLAIPPEEITLGGIIMVLDDGPTLVECGEHAEICSRSETCVTRHIWREISQVILEKLESITLADLCQRAQDMGQGVEDVF